MAKCVFNARQFSFMMQMLMMRAKCTHSASFSTYNMRNTSAIVVLWVNDSFAAQQPLFVSVNNICDVFFLHLFVRSYGIANPGGSSWFLLFKLNFRRVTVSSGCKIQCLLNCFIMWILLFFAKNFAQQKQHHQRNEAISEWQDL